MDRDDEIEEADWAIDNIASQKPYSPSPDVGLLSTMIPKTCSPGRRCMSTNEMK
jgi:hypothetical protein